MPRKPKSKDPLFEGRLKEGTLVQVTLKPKYFFHSEPDVVNVLVRDSELIERLPKEECLGRTTILFYERRFIDGPKQRVIGGEMPAFGGRSCSMERPLKAVVISEEKVANYAVYQKGITYKLTR